MAGETTRDALEAFDLLIAEIPSGWKDYHEMVTAVETVRAALSREEGTPWRPIETAPKDELVILWGRNVWDIGRLDAVNAMPFATHWMPLPVGPALDLNPPHQEPARRGEA